MAKFFIGVLAFSLILSLSMAYPTDKGPDDDVEVVVVPMENENKFNRKAPVIPSPDFDHFDGVIESGFGPEDEPVIFSSIPINPYNWNFGFFNRINDFVRQIRDQIASSWSRIPISWADEAAKNGNTTSTVKIVDGQKVIINETLYTKKTEFGDAVYKVRVIDVQPLDGGSSAEFTTTLTPSDADQDKNVETFATDRPVSIPRDVEPLETLDENDNKNSSPEDLDIDRNNEISKNIDENDDVERFESTEINVSDIKDGNSSDENKNIRRNIVQISDNKLGKLESSLSSELNQPHASTLGENKLELFGEDESDENYDNNQHTLDIFENSVPIDLSNDIAVNQILADQNAPTNLDAEIFNANQFDSNEQEQQTQRNVEGQAFEYLPFYPNDNTKQINIKK